MYLREGHLCSILNDSNGFYSSPHTYKVGFFLKLHLITKIIPLCFYFKKSFIEVYTPFLYNF